MINSSLNSKNYDPHILYHAINLTVELKYQIPMQAIYKILDDIDSKGKEINSEEVLELLKTLQKALDKKLMCNNKNEDAESSERIKNKKERIKELLSLCGCSLSNEELNKILKGEISIDDVMSKKAKILWKLAFDQQPGEKPMPNYEIINNMMWSVQKLELEHIEEEAERIAVDKQNRKQQLKNGIIGGNYKTYLTAVKKQDNQITPQELDKKRKELRIYIGRMQGYDRDRDGDGSRGMDMSTGYIIDYDDVYIADKEHGSVIEDMENDGLDLEDIK